MPVACKEFLGELEHNITDLDFVDDLLEDDDGECFRKHNCFMRLLREDIRLVVNNFSVTATKDSFLSIPIKGKLALPPFYLLVYLFYNF